MNILAYSKAITALLVGLVAIILGHFGLTPDAPVTEVVGALVTAGLVWFVPNTKAQ